MTRLETVFQRGRVSTLLGLLQLSDEEAYNHTVAVAEIVNEYLTLAEKHGELEWDEEQCLEIVSGALLHDIGKAFLPFGLQYSARKLTEYEQEIMKMHPLLGVVAIKNSNMSQIVEDIILMHHANADGSGYPDMKSKKFDIGNVPEYVWLVSYADKFEAMTSSRSFKQAMSYTQAWRELLNMSRKELLPYKYTRLFGELVRERNLFPEKTDEVCREEDEADGLCENCK